MCADFASAFSSVTAAFGNVPTAITTQYVNLGQQQLQNWNQMQAALNPFNSAIASSSTEQKAKKPERELSANEQWLNDRVNEMRVKL